MPTIAERYCARHRINAERFARRALLRSLPLQGLLLYPLLSALPGFFDPDLEFVRDIGRQRTLRDFAVDAVDFKIHPDNSSFARRVLKLRVSSRKLRRHLATALAENDASQTPARA